MTYQAGPPRARPPIKRAADLIAAQQTANTAQLVARLKDEVAQDAAIIASLRAELDKRQAETATLRADLAKVRAALNPTERENMLLHKSSVCSQSIADQSQTIIALNHKIADLEAKGHSHAAGFAQERQRMEARLAAAEAARLSTTRSIARLMGPTRCAVGGYRATIVEAFTQLYSGQALKRVREEFGTGGPAFDSVVRNLLLYFPKGWLEDTTRDCPPGVDPLQFLYCQIVECESVLSFAHMLFSVCEFWSATLKSNISRAQLLIKLDGIHSQISSFVAALQHKAPTVRNTLQNIKPIDEPLVVKSKAPFLLY